jgi:hypothetical protein
MWKKLRMMKFFFSKFITEHMPLRGPFGKLDDPEAPL